MNNQHDVLVEVEDLSVHFYLREGTVRAVNGVSFAIRHGQTLGVIGESGSGKSVSAQAIMGILPTPPAKLESGRITMHLPEGGAGYRSVTLTELPTRGSEYRSIRGKEIGIIFQEPMTAFSPVHTSRRAARHGRHRPQPPECLSPRTLRRDAPTRPDRHGTGLQSQAGDR